MTLSDYVKQHISGLIDKVAEQGRLAETDTTGDGVHDLRVAIRRLAENLRVFEDLFPRGAAKKVRKELRAAMRLAGDARNHDIAAELMRRAKVPAKPDVAAGRARAAVKLAKVLRAWNRDAAERAWREGLHV